MRLLGGFELFVDADYVIDFIGGAEGTVRSLKNQKLSAPKPPQISHSLA